MKNDTIILAGPSLEAVSGVSTHLRLILNSALKEKFNLVHFRVGSQGHSENPLQKAVRLISSPFQLGLLIWRERPAVVHLNASMDVKSFWRDSLYLLVGKALNCKVIYQLHGGEMPRSFCKNSRIYTLVLKKVLRKSDEIVLLGDYAMLAYDDFCPGLRLNKIPNSIDHRFYEPVKAKQLDSGNCKLGYIGRLADNKGIMETLEAIKRLEGDPVYENLEFLIAGSGPAEEAIRERTRNLGLEDKVTLMGPVFGQRKIDFWKEIDLFLFPTYHKEGLPYSLLESLASGTPMITTREGGIGELINEGDHGVFVKPGDPDDIAEALRKLFGKEGNHYSRMSKACSDLARDKFGIETMENAFSRLYSKLVTPTDQTVRHDGRTV